MNGPLTSTTPTWRYKAFISYSHSSDARLAAALQSALQRFAKPWYRLRSMRLFRDATGLSANPGLWSSIERALNASEYLILLASPSSASSTWVSREVQQFLGTRSSSHLLLVVTAGDVQWDASTRDFDWSRTTALPQVLAGAFGEEPLFVDLRALDTTKPEQFRDPAFHNAVADVATALSGRSKDEVVGDDVLQHRRTKRVAWAGGVSLVTLAALAGVAGRTAVEQRGGIAREQQITLATGLIARAEQAKTQRADMLPLSVLLALESMRLSPSDEARASLRASLSLLAAPGTLMEQGAPVAAMSLSGDGKRLLATDSSGTARVWSTDSAKTLTSIEFGSVFASTISPDGRQIAIADVDGVRLIDIASGNVSARVGASIIARALAFSADGERLATAAFDGTILVHDLPSGRELARMKHDIIAMGIAFSADGRFVFTGSNDKTARLWNVMASREVVRLPHQFGVTSVAISPDGEQLATGSWDGMVRVWARHTRVEIARFTHLPMPTSLVFSNDGRLLASSSNDRTARVWDIASAGEILRMTHAGAVTAVLFTPDGRSLATGSADSTVRLWSIAGDRESARFVGEGLPFSIAPSPDGRAAASGIDTTVAVWDVSSGALITRLSQPSRVSAVAYSPRGGLIATAADDGLRVWDLPVSRAPRWVPFARATRDVAFSPDGRRVATSSDEQVVQLWNARTLKEEARLQHGDSAMFMMDVAFSADGMLLATTSSNGVRVWDLASGKVLRRLANRSDINRVAFAPDGRTLATASRDHTARIFDWRNDSEQQRFVSAESVTDVSFSPDGRFLATSSRDRTARVWEIASGAEVARMTHGGAVSAVAFTRDGGLVLSAGSDRTSRAWRWHVPDITKHACSRLLRNLTLQEWSEYVGTVGYHRSCDNLR